MPESEEAVRRYLEAATSGADDAYAALSERVAEDATATSPLASGTGRDAVLDGLRRAQPMLAAATWADPVVDNDAVDAVKVAGTLPPGSVLGTATLTFRFDGDGRIVQLQQALTPGAPSPPVPVALDGAIATAVNGALDNGTPIIAAYVDRNGQPQLSLRGTTQVYSSDQVALWIRDPKGGLVRALPDSPRLSFFYRDPAARTFLQIQGCGRVDDDPHVRDVVFDNSPEREQSIDPDRRGVAVIVDVDHVQGRLADGPVNMSRDAH
jgi:SnoaL-like domain